MKKRYLLFFSLGDGGTLYTPSVPDAGSFNNRNLNPTGSQYANTFGHASGDIISKIVRKQIYETSPKQYADLTLLSMKKSIQKDSDEFSYHEMGWGRDAVVSAIIPADIAAGTNQVIPIQNMKSVHLDMIVTYPDNTKGTIVEINTGAGTITVKSLTWETLPLIVAGPAGSLVLANHSTVEADGADDIKKYSRFETVERTNFIQFFVEAQRYGKVEMEKLKRSGKFDNYIELQRKEMYKQHRIGLSNTLWNGTKGEVTLSNGEKAKTAGGLYPMMLEAGSPNSSTTMATLPSAFEELVLDTEYGAYGQRRFLYGTPRSIHYLCQQYKRNLTRYTPNDTVAKLELQKIEMGSSEIVFVPVKLFEERSCFPAQFRNKMFLVDQESLQPCHFFPEMMGNTLDRVGNGTLQNYVNDWISSSISFEYTNPLAGGWLNITDLP